MTVHDRDPVDPQLGQLISVASSTQAPSPGYADRVLNELRGRGLVRSERRSVRMLVAASWFIAGVGAGATAQYFIRSEEEHSSREVASAQSSRETKWREPEVWY